VQSAHVAVRSLVDAGVVADATAHAGAASVLRVTGAGERVLADVMLMRLDAEFRANAPGPDAALEGCTRIPSRRSLSPLTGTSRATSP